MKRITSLLLLFSLLFSLAATAFADEDGTSFEAESAVIETKGTNDSAAADAGSGAPTPVTEATIVIHDASELLALADKCTLDTWSYGKTVVLANDIDLADIAYTSIPVFSGTFDGGGHTIRNLKIDYSGSTLGFIRHVGRGGQIKNLHITGTVAPDGIREKVGGIAGQNSGTIIGCTFSGSVAGETTVGGIAGYNDSTGIITDCRVTGSVTGKTKIGGIAGENAGSVFASENGADINTVPMEFSASTVVDSVLSVRSTAELTEITDTVKDIGGIAGYSTGAIRDCKNTGTVGYIHIGYNIGGIVGRHGGTVRACENTGVVYGRRNTGGIVGEMEPYTAWVVSEDALTSLRDALNTLQERTNTLLDDVKMQSNTLSEEMKTSIGHLDAAEAALDEMLTATTDFANGNIDAINEVSLRISEFLDGMDAISDDFTLFFDDLNAASADIAVFTDELKASVDDGVTPALDCLHASMSILSGAFSTMEVSLTEVSDGFYALKRSLGDPDAMYAAMQALSLSFQELAGAVNTASQDISALIDNLYNDGTYYYDAFLTALRDNLTNLNDDLMAVSEAFAALGEAVREYILTGDKALLESALAELSEAIRASADSLYGAIHSFTYLGEGMKKMLEDLRIGIPGINEDLSRLGTALGNVSGAIGSVIGEMDVRALSEALSDFGAAMDHMAYTFGDVSKALDTASEAKQYTDIALQHFSAALGAVSAATESVTTAVNSLDRAANAANGLVSTFAAKEPIQFVRIDERFSTAQTTLFTELKNLSASVNILVDTAASELLINDLRALSDQLYRTFGVLIDLADTVTDVSTDPETYRDDVSDEEARYTDGVTEKCKNSGNIESDYNAGGIVGNISVDIALDMENDLHLSGLLSKSAKHLIYAVVMDCENYATVTGKYAGVGGIAGNMDYGRISSGVSGGTIQSTEGDYVGGIAGYSAGTIANCLSRVNLSGKNYIGGIAGRAETVTGSYALVAIDTASERAGAICGAYEGEIRENYFATASGSTTYGGIDGISYAGKAEPVTYDALLTGSGNAALFSDTIVTFVKDGETVKQLHVPFGGAVDADEIPVIPDKDGKYWVWDSFDRTAVYANLTVEGTYRAPLTTISTGEEIPLFLVEGQFHTEQKLTATEWTPDFAALGMEEEIETYAAYKLSVNDYENDLRVRMHHAGTGKLWLLHGGTLEKLSFTVDGTYIVFTIPNGASFVFIDGGMPSHTTAILLSVSAAVVALSGILVAGMLLRKRSKRNGKGRRRPTPANKGQR